MDERPIGGNPCGECGGEYGVHQNGCRLHQTRLKSVDSHNADVIRRRKEQREAALKTGVACPSCHCELHWRNANNAHMLQYPQSKTREAYCSDCKLAVELET